MAQWVNWNGDKQPVPNGQFVCVRFRNGHTFTGPASRVCWNHDTGNPENDVTHFQITHDFGRNKFVEVANGE